MIVELHILQNFAPSCLNRDDTNSPKECEFGGYHRARISSQCIKRAVREYFKDNNLLGKDNLATRTLLITKELSQRLASAGKTSEDAAKASIEAIKSIGLKFKDEKKGAESKTQYLLFIGELEIESIADCILSHWDEIHSGDASQVTKEIMKSLNGGKASDLALFGRMLADLPGKNIDAACQVAHAISTHKAGREFDFYTAVDDLQKDDETGAGMMGDIEYNSACYYRYANINLKQLEDNLGGNAELTRKSVEAFVRAAIAAIPSGKQTSFSAQNPPDFVLAIVRGSGTWSLANAFAKPVPLTEKTNLTKDSIEALVDYWGKLNQAYGGNDSKMTKVAFSLIPAVELTDLDRVSGLEELVEKVNQAIENYC